MIDPALDSPTKAGADITSISIMIMSMADVLPSAAALLTVVWTIIRIWETKTVGKVVGRKKDKDD